MATNLTLNEIAERFQVSTVSVHRELKIQGST